MEEPTAAVEPKLPDGYDTLTGEEKAEADELYRRQTLFHYYRVCNGVRNQPHLTCLKDPLLHPRKHLVDRAGRQWNGNVLVLKGALVRMVECWPMLPDTAGVKCPVEFSPQELEEFHKNENILFCLNATVNHWREQMGGASEEGWVGAEQYEGAVKRNQELKEEMLAAAGNDEEDIESIQNRWFFRDHEEIY